MYLIKILGNDKTNNLCMNLRYDTIGFTMNDREKIDDILSLLDDINQPITMNLSSILHLACQFATDTEIVEYLLSLNANPNYLDANADDAYRYVDDNIVVELRPKLKKLLDKFAPLFPKENKHAREQQGWHWFDVMLKKSCHRN